MTEPKLTTPVAIIVAGALVGVGAFFGMRARPASTSSTSSTSSTVTAPPSSPGSPARVSGAEATTSRGSALAPPVLPQPSSSSVAAASAAAPPELVPAAPPPLDDARAKVIEEVKHQFEALRPALIERCWKPAIKAQSEPKTARLTFNFGFAADGQQLSRGVMEDRRSNRVGLSTCVSDAIPMFPVAAPGVSTYVEVPFELP